MLACLGEEVEAVLEEGRPLGEHPKRMAYGGADLRTLKIKGLEFALYPPVELLKGEIEVLGGLLHDLEAQGLVLKAQ